MSYTLLLHICSLLHGNCMTPMSNGVLYPDFASCLLEGSKSSHELTIELPKAEINKHKLYVQFACIKNSEPDT